MNIIHGDCLEELKKLEDNSIDAVVCDPPYGLSNTKPQQVADVLKAWVTGDTVSVPAKNGGFMGADWDSFVPPPAVWEECIRVLKPGGHMAVFAGARTQDLMGLSIRLAGFEIRDTMGWVYGSGFPKSMDISKAIDRQRNDKGDAQAVGKWLRKHREDKGITQKEIAKHWPSKTGGLTGCVANWEGGFNVPKLDQWEKLKELLSLPDDMDAEVWRLNGRKGTPGEAWEKREVVGKYQSGLHTGPSGVGGHGEGGEVTTSHSDAAKQWDGWGTALKPAIEPIILARKPLDGTVASNVLAHGVGGLNIDACRVDGASAPAGRFPANVLLDEHAAKEMDEQSGVLKSGANLPHHVMKNAGDVYGTYGPMTGYNIPADSGGASRFFPVFKYQAKAPKKERPVIESEDGSKIQHPTVKPEKLMEWLVELITPPGGVVLDPFAGSGTTLQAALNKGFQPIGIEQEADYIQLIKKRLGLINE